MKDTNWQKVTCEVIENGEVITDSNIVSVEFDGIANITIKIKIINLILALIKRLMK